MASTSYATPSSSQSPPLKLNYEVFLSFRGEDVRKNFLEHLNFQLKLKGIHTFKDDDRLKIGDSIGPELLKAIKESRIAIVIFSKDYASSTWCLEEVATIMECKEEQRQIVVPIFFHVEPSHVRKQEGSFKDSFEKHEAKFSEDMVERWKKALTQAAGIKGHDLDAQYNGNELDCIQGVVDDIFTKLPPPPGVQENLVGIEQPLKDISKLMEEPKVVEGLEGVLLSFRNSSYDENISPNIEAFKQMAKLKMLIVEFYRYCSQSRMREQEEAGSHGRVPTQAELDDMFVEEMKRRIDLAFGSDSQSELGESDDESESQLIEHGVAEAEMAEYSTDVQTIEERGIRFRTCIASFIWLRQKLATMCTGSADSNDSGKDVLSM
nr:TMV resistance protein N-like [Ipomoea batatas]